MWVGSQRIDAGSGRRSIGRAVLVVVTSLMAVVGLGFGFRALGLGEANLLLFFVMGVSFVAFVAGRGASVAAAVLSVLLFNFFFTVPVHTFAVADRGYLFTFAMLLLSGLGVSELLTRKRELAARAGELAKANHVLYQVGRVLTSTTGRSALAREAAREVERWLPVRARIVLPEEVEGAVVETGADAGNATVSLLGAESVPLGRLVVSPAPGGGPLPERWLLDSLAGQIALALERDSLARTAQERAVQVEGERLRADLLASVSHDLRTPLAAICGTAGILVARDDVDPAERSELLGEILSESERLTRMVENLLQLARLENGVVRVSKEWYPLEEVVASSLARLTRCADTGRVRVDLPDEPLLVPMDADLLVNVFQNLLENALRCAPEGAIDVEAHVDGDWLEVNVSDRGPGWPPGSSERLFERFVRGSPQNRPGTGLGLTICRAIVAAHGGTISAEQRGEGGALLRFRLPMEGGLELESELQEHAETSEAIP